MILNVVYGLAARQPLHSIIPRAINGNYTQLCTYFIKILFAVKYENLGNIICRII